MSYFYQPVLVYISVAISCKLIAVETPSYYSYFVVIARCFYWLIATVYCNSVMLCRSITFLFSILLSYLVMKYLKIKETRKQNTKGGLLQNNILPIPIELYPWIFFMKILLSRKLKLFKRAHWLYLIAKSANT